MFLALISHDSHLCINEGSVVDEAENSFLVGLYWKRCSSPPLLVAIRSPASAWHAVELDCEEQPYMRGRRAFLLDSILSGQLFLPMLQGTIIPLHTPQCRWL